MQLISFEATPSSGRRPRKCMDHVLKPHTDASRYVLRGCESDVDVWERFRTAFLRSKPVLRGNASCARAHLGRRLRFAAAARPSYAKIHVIFERVG
jgi:hypothetical protein